MSAATYYKSFFSLQILFCKYHTLIQVAYAKYLNRFYFMFLNLIFHKFKTFALNIWFSEMRGPVWDFQTTSKDCRKIGLGNGGIQLNLLKLTLILNNRWQLFKYSTKTPVCAPPSSILPGQVFSSDFSFLLPQTHSTLSLLTQNRQKSLLEELKKIMLLPYMISEPLLISHLKQILTEWTSFSFYGEPPPKLITHFVSCFLSSENCYCRDDRKHNICQTKMLLVWVTLCTQIIEYIFWCFHDNDEEEVC